MRLRIRNIRQKQKLASQRYMRTAGQGMHQEERDPAGQIDVDELLEDEHPLHSWVETKVELDVPLFDPEDHT